MYIVHCTLYDVHCTLYDVHCTLYTVHCSLYTVQCCCSLLQALLLLSTALQKSVIAVIVVEINHIHISRFSVIAISSNFGWLEPVDDFWRFHSTRRLFYSFLFCIFSFFYLFSSSFNLPFILVFPLLAKLGNWHNEYFLKTIFFLISFVLPSLNEWLNDTVLGQHRLHWVS